MYAVTVTVAVSNVRSGGSYSGRCTVGGVLKYPGVGILNIGELKKMQETREETARMTIRRRTGEEIVLPPPRLDLDIYCSTQDAQT